MDELENWCQERLVGDLCKYEAQQGGIHGNHVFWKPVLPASTNQLPHTGGTSVKILT